MSFFKKILSLPEHTQEATELSHNSAVAEWIDETLSQLERLSIPLTLELSDEQFDAIRAWIANNNYPTTAVAA